MGGRLVLLVVLSTVTLWWPALVTGFPDASGDPTNVLVIVTDDQRFDKLPVMPAHWLDTASRWGPVQLRLRDDTPVPLPRPWIFSGMYARHSHADKLGRRGRRER